MLENHKTQKRKTLGNSKRKPRKETMASSAHEHPDHSVHVARLRRVKGQIEGIERMIGDRRYCPDIIAQLKAASAALKAVEAEVFKSHLRGCVKSAFNGGDAFNAEERIQEIIKLVY